MTLHDMANHSISACRIASHRILDLSGEHSGVELVCFPKGLLVESLVDEVDDPEHAAAVGFLEEVRKGKGRLCSSSREREGCKMIESERAEEIQARRRKSKSKRDVYAQARGRGKGLCE